MCLLRQGTLLVVHDQMANPRMEFAQVPIFKTWGAMENLWTLGWFATSDFAMLEWPSFPCSLIRKVHSPGVTGGTAPVQHPGKSLPLLQREGDFHGRVFAVGRRKLCRTQYGDK